MSCNATIPSSRVASGAISPTFLFGGNPLIVSWIAGNIGGLTTKSMITSLFDADSSAGSITGPLLVNKKERTAISSWLEGCASYLCSVSCGSGYSVGESDVVEQAAAPEEGAEWEMRIIVDSSMLDRYVGLDEAGE